MTNIIQKFDAFGLDISDSFLRFAKLEKSGNHLKLISFGEIEVPSGIVESGEIKDEKVLGRLIKTGLAKVKGKKIKTKYVISSLPEEKSFLDVFQVPLVGEKELSQTVMFEAENQIPMGLAEAEIDFEVLNSLSDNRKLQEVLVAAMPKKIINGYLSAFQEAGLIPVALEIECLAIVRALVKKDNQTDSLLIIDLGQNRASFMIFSGGGLRFTSTIPISAKLLTNSISSNLKVSLDKAETLKKSQGLEGSKEVFDAMIPVLTDLAEQIKNHLRYYHSHISKNINTRTSRKVERILLCGRGVNLKGLVSFLAADLKLEVSLGNPWINILGESFKDLPKLSFQDSLGYVTALGLALRGIK